MKNLLPELWLGLSFLGLALSFLALRQVAMDYMSARILTNGRRAVAITGMIGESLRFVMYLLFAGVGLFYLITGHDVRRAGVGFIMLLALALLLIKTSIQLWLNNYLFVTSLEDQNRGGEKTQEEIEDLHFGEQRRELEAAHIEEEKR